MESVASVDWVAVMEAVAMIISACAIISAATPTKIDDRIFGKAAKVYNLISRLLNIGAINVGKAKNADDF